MNITNFTVRLAKKLVYRVLPGSARLPFNGALDSVAGCIEPELRHIGASCKGRGAAIDVGANIGIYSYRMARIFSKVYEFEINKGTAGNLVAYIQRRSR